MIEEPFPWPRGSLLAPPPQYAALRAEGPVVRVAFRSGQPVWVVTRHQAVRLLLLDRRLSSEHSHPRYPPVFPVAKHRQADGRRPKLTYSGMDRPEHTAHRRMIADEFTARRVATLRPRIVRIVRHHVDRMAAGPQPADLMASLAEPVSSDVISELLGVPEPDRLIFRRLSQSVLSHGADPQHTAAASTELRALVARLVAAKAAAPTDDLLGRLVGRYRRAGTYDHDEMVQFAGALITAGHETTANMIGLGTVVLLRHPDQLAAIRRQSFLLAPAVEELFRYLSIADIVTARVALGEVAVGRATIGAGDGVVALGAAANHDPRAFDQPETFDIRRDTRRHVAFGAGIHKCLGQHLARLELQVAFAVLLRRLPALRLATSVDDLEARQGGVIHGARAVPVTW